MRIVTKILTLLTILTLLILGVNALVDIDIIKDIATVIMKNELYIIIYLMVVSIAASGLEEDDSAVSSDMAILIGALALGIIIFFSASGQKIVPTGASVVNLVTIFLNFVAGYVTLLDFVFSFSVAGFIFLGLFVYVNNIKADSSFAKKVKLLSKFSLFITVTILAVASVLTMMKVDDFSELSINLLICSVEMLIYSSILINIIDYSYNVEIEDVDVIVPAVAPMHKMVNEAVLPKHVENHLPDPGHGVVVTHSKTSSVEPSLPPSAMGSGVKIFMDPNQDNSPVVSAPTIDTPLQETVSQKHFLAADENLIPIAAGPVKREDTNKANNDGNKFNPFQVSNTAQAPSMGISNDSIINNINDINKEKPNNAENMDKIFNPTNTENK